MTDLDLGGTTIKDLKPILKPELRQLAFPYHWVASLSIDELRKLPNLQRIGPSWDALVKTGTGWSAYDAGDFPGSRPVAVTIAQETPLAKTEVNPEAQDAIPSSRPVPVVVAETAPPATFNLRALTIPTGASPQVHDSAKAFNDATRDVLATLTQKRKEATKLVSDAMTKDWKREVQLLSKDDSRLPVFDTLKSARQALEAGAGPRDPAFTNDKLPEATMRACADWRNTMEPLEESAIQVVEEHRLRAMNELEPLTNELKSGASAVLEQLEAMKPNVAQHKVVVDPLPVDGAVWRIDCISALPRDQTLLDHTGVQGPARVTGEIWETSFGKALRGDGLTAQATTNLRKPLADRTLMCWVNLATYNQRDAGIIALQAPDGRAEAITYLDSVRGWGVLDENRRSLASKKFGHDTDDWNHLALSVEGTLRRLYLNGTLIGEDQSGRGSFPAGSELVIGRRGTEREASYCAGMLDGALVFERALNLAEISKVLTWQARQGELIRTTRRAREWLPLPFNNGDFSKISGNRAADWVGRLDGVLFPADENGRFLRLELERVGQEARSLRQFIRLDPSLREVRVAARIRLPTAINDSHIDSLSALGVQIVFIDPSKQLPELRRTLAVPEKPPVNSWLELSREVGWPIPAGYQSMAVECTLRGYLGYVDIDDVMVSALPGRP